MADYTLLEIEAPEDLDVQDLVPLADADWKGRIDLTQRIGDRWIDSRDTPLARAPSAVMP